ncbi:MAG: HAMP domain-containing histidine kinase [Ruminococcaceae bacterium]|nr:HAMP domain-containing histidine kinase [Oscillospiraceae bacterium]
MKKIIEKHKAKKKTVQVPLLEEVSFFSIKGYIVAVLMALTVALIPPLIFEFRIEIFFSKFGIPFIIYYILMAIVCYRFILHIIKINYSKHLQKISEATRKVAKGDFSVEIELDESLKDNSYINIMFRDFNTMVAELNSIESLKDDFISNVSHEIKTPLSIINNYTTALKDKDLPEKIREEYIETVIESTDKLSDLVTNILRLSKIENRKILPEKREYDLCRQLSDCLLSFENVWEEKGIELVVQMEDRVVVNETFAFLDIIWHNLLSNAFKFTEKGGKVSLIQTSTDEFIEVRIKDTGCGIDEETKAHIFDKFYQGDTSHAEEGNGLGLALVQKIAERNGYEITIESEVNKGTEFIVKIKK